MPFKHTLGIQIDRAVSVLPQTVATPGTPYFRVATGYVLVTGLVGIFTVAAGGACNATWCHNPTAGVDTDFCAATALAGAVAAGYIMTVSGVVTETMLPLAGSVAQLMGGIVGAGGKGLVFGPGDLGVFTNASVLGNWRWMLWYVPLEAGAVVTAV